MRHRMLRVLGGVLNNKGGITIRGANGTAVLILPFTGHSSRDRKRRAADLILAAVNGHYEAFEVRLLVREKRKGEPHTQEPGL